MHVLDISEEVSKFNFCKNVHLDLAYATKIAFFLYFFDSVFVSCNRIINVFQFIIVLLLIILNTQAFQSH